MLHVKNAQAVCPGLLTGYFYGTFLPVTLYSVLLLLLQLPENLDRELVIKVTEQLFTYTVSFPETIKSSACTTTIKTTFLWSTSGTHADLLYNAPYQTCLQVPYREAPITVGRHYLESMLQTHNLARHFPASIKKLHVHFHIKFCLHKRLLNVPVLQLLTLLDSYHKYHFE